MSSHLSDTRADDPPNAAEAHDADAAFDDPPTAAEAHDAVAATDDPSTAVEAHVAVAATDDPSTAVEAHVADASIAGVRPKLPRRRTSERAGLRFPVSRVSKSLRAHSRASRVSRDAGVYLAAVGEYLVRELCDTSVAAAKANRKRRVSSAHVSSAIRDDAEMVTFVGDPVIPGSSHVTAAPEPTEPPRKHKRKAEAKVRSERAASVARGRWQFSESGGWKDYDAQASATVEHAYQTYLADPANWDVRAVQSGTWMYQVDFGAMRQKNVQHGDHKERDIRRV